MAVLLELRQALALGHPRDEHAGQASGKQTIGPDKMFVDPRDHQITKSTDHQIQLSVSFDR